MSDEAKEHTCGRCKWWSFVHCDPRGRVEGNCAAPVPISFSVDDCFLMAKDVDYNCHTFNDGSFTEKVKWLCGKVQDLLDMWSSNVSDFGGLPDECNPDELLAAVLACPEMKGNEEKP